MRTSIWASIAVPALLCLGAASASAASQDESLRVIGRSGMTWRGAMMRDIGANLVLPRPSLSEAPEGVVKVTFVPTNGGAPVDIRLVEGSGSAALDRAALFAISRVRTAGAAAAGKPVQAWIYFANTEASADKMEARLRREASSLAAADRPLMIPST